MDSQQQIETDKPWLFKPGQSGNPGGRPKGSVSLVAIMLKQLAEQHPDEPEKTRAEKVVKAAIDQAEAGNFQMFKEILERTDGKVKEQVEVTRKDITETVATIRTKLGKTREPAELN